MTDQELINLLKKHKDAPELGGDLTGARADRAWLRVCEMNGWDSKAVGRFRWTPKVWMDFYAWKLSHAVVQPMAVAMASLFLALGGWTAAANAGHSAPGDALYPMKLAGERMRLRFASTPTQRAELQVAYAGRRVREIAEVTRSNASDKEARVKTAADQFNRQIASVNEDLAAIKASDPDAAAVIAAIVEEKTAAYETELTASEVQQTVAVQEQVAEAVKAADEAGSAARTTLVESHETTGEARTVESMKTAFQGEYVRLRSRIAFSLGRLSVIEAYLNDRGGGTLEVRGDIDEARNAVSFHEKRLRDAMDFLAQGGYRRAFELLDEVGASVAASEGIITALEIAITTGTVADQE